MSSGFRSRFFVLTVILAAGAGIAPSSSFALSEKGFQALHTFSKIISQVEENYYTDVDEEKLIRGAIRGLLYTLDPHSVYMSPDVYRELKVDTKGRFDGIGIEAAVRGGRLTVVAPIKGSPASRQGIKAGDRIVKIDGHPTEEMNLTEAVSKLRGKRGSKVTLSILRAGKKQPFDVTITRQKIDVPSVNYSMEEGNVARISVNVFQQGTGDAIEKALKELKKKGDIKGLVLDLRGNPGGLLEEAVKVSDIFLDKGVIVTTETRGKEIDRHEAHAEGTEPSYPIVVLVDSGSASASEIVAAALQDNRRATVMGATSFGKGSVQTVIDLGDGSGLKLTVARYLTPAKKVIHDIGVKPDVVVPAVRPPEDGGKKEDESKEKEDVVVKKEEPKEDYQLIKAVEYLKNGGK